MSKSFFKIMVAPTTSLNSKELKIQALGTLIMLSIMNFILSFFISLLFPNTFLATFLSLEPIIFFGFLLIWIWNFLEKNFSLYSTNDHVNLSFNGQILIFLLIGSGIFIGACIMGYFMNNLIQGLGFGILIFYPLIIMFFRRKTCFNEKSQKISNKENLVFGYAIPHYWMLGSFCGYFTIGYGFSCISLYLNTGKPPLLVCFSIIIFSMLIVSLILCPDWMNKFLPFEIRKKNGFYLYSALSVGICFLILIILAYLIATFFWY